MRPALHLRLCGAIAGFSLSLPLLAVPASAPQSVGQQREDVLFCSQAKREGNLSRF